MAVIIGHSQVKYLCQYITNDTIFSLCFPGYKVQDLLNESSVYDIVPSVSRKRKETTSEKIEKKFQQRATESFDTDKFSQTTSVPQQQHQQVYSCDVRLRVKVEYVDHQEVLGNSVHSHKQTEIERQFEKFSQASNILKSRDLGTVVCDIKFSELTSLDAFWRDYTNGALLEALNVVFITESLSEAVGHEPLRLLVSVDEEDYRKGRLILLKNLIT